MKVLVADDDRVLADVVAFTLKREGFDVSLAFDGKTALAKYASEEPDLIILDVNMPGMDGFQVCKTIREESLVPIILLTVRGEEDDIIQGLGIGADDYIVKPFSPRQLVARAQAVMRRAGQTVTSGVMQAGNLVLTAHNRSVTVGDGDQIRLTMLETRLLEYMVVNAGQVITKNTLIDHVWGPLGGDQDMLRQVIHRLRNKIESDSTNPKYLKTVPGLGYGLLIDMDDD
jgi:DNA-binding response OmpR family regulator